MGLEISFIKTTVSLHCFVHPIFLSFGFWYFGHFSCVIFIPVFFSSCPSYLAKCKQRYFRILATLLPKLTKTNNGINETKINKILGRFMMCTVIEILPRISFEGQISFMYLTITLDTLVLTSDT